MVVLNSLQQFWKNPSCPTKFKLLVHDAVIRSKLIYGLDSLCLTAADVSRLNTFQLKGLRKILNMKTTFVDRSNTNNTVLAAASQVRNPKRLPNKDFTPYGQLILNTQQKLLTHIARAPESDPMRPVSYTHLTLPTILRV